MPAANAAAPLPTREPALPPGPSAGKLSQILHWIRDPEGFLERYQRELGSTYTVRFWEPFDPSVMVTDPAHVKQLYALGEDKLQVAELQGWIEWFTGPGSVLVLDGERHNRERKLIMPAFQGDNLKAMAGDVNDAVDAVLAEWEREPERRIVRDMQRITVRVILRLVLGLEAGPMRGELEVLLPHMFTRAQLPVLIKALRVDLGPWSPWGYVTRAQKRVHALVLDHIRAARGTDLESADTFFGRLLRATDDTGRRLTDEELRAELIGLFLAGSDTTSMALSWACHHLLKQPELIQPIRDEVAEVCAGGVVRGDDVRKLKYTAAVFEETLRVQPMFPVHGRRSPEPIDLGDVVIPANVPILIAPHVVHRTISREAGLGGFDPRRMLETPKLHNTLIPFGGGVRRCVGIHLARFEGTIALASIFSRFHMERIGREDRPVRHGAGLKPDREVRVRVRRL